MKINEKYQQTEKCERLILMNVQNIVLVIPPIKKINKSKNV